MKNYEFGVALGTSAYTKASLQDKKIIRFGMIPQPLLLRVGLDINAMNGEVSRGFAAGVFKCAKSDGGMVA